MVRRGELGWGGPRPPVGDDAHHYVFRCSRSIVRWVSARARALSREYTVYLWDMPGYGQSSKDPAHAVPLRANLLHGATYASLALIDVVALR